MSIARKDHWENVYNTKSPEQVSWTQDIPQISLDFIHSFGMDKSASIIDIGGGDSKLVDCLLQEGYENITVLDISSIALERAKSRLGDKASRVSWIVSDITEFQPANQYHIWHDRAAFHFLKDESQISRYVEIASASVTQFLTIGTFSKSGPLKCSGLEISQYDEHSLLQRFENNFVKLRCLTQDHITPFNTVQNFLFCSFKRKI